MVPTFLLIIEGVVELGEGRVKKNKFPVIPSVLGRSEI